jgi:hypothetical protein
MAINPTNVAIKRLDIDRSPSAAAQPALTPTVGSKSQRTAHPIADLKADNKKTAQDFQRGFLLKAFSKKIET